MPTRSFGTFKKSGDSVASPDFRLSGRNSPSDPAKVDVGLASVRTLLIQLADFSLDFQLVKDECFVENESGTYSVDRDKVLALFQEVMTIRAQQDGWKLAPTKAEVTQLGNSPPANFSRRVSTDEYRFAWPAGHARLASAPGPPSPQAQTPQVQVPRNGSTPQAARSSTPPPDGANGSVPASDAETRFAELLAKFQDLEDRVRKTESTTDQLEREGAGTSSTAISLSTEEFSDLLLPQLRQAVSRPLGVLVPDTSTWGHSQIELEYFESGLSEADRKKLLRGYKMDPRLALAPGKLEEQDRKKFTASARERETVLYKQGTLYRDFTRTLVHSIDRSAQALAEMCKLVEPAAWDPDQWAAHHLTAINLQASALSAQRDQYRLLSSAASTVERERQEMVIKAVHPRYTLPEQANKPISRKLLPEEMRADARQFDQSMFFSDKGNTARPPAPRGASSKRQPRARKRPRSQMQVEPDNPALPVPSASKQGPPTPGTKNKSNGGKVGDRAGSLKKN